LVAGAVAAFLAWLGVSVVVLADGRRGLSVGLAVASAGIAVVAWQSSGPVAAVAVIVAGGIAALVQDRSGGGEWIVMPPGSTPRTVMCVAGGLVALWIAAAVTSGAGVAMRFTLVTVLGLAGARVLTSSNPWAVRTACALIALALAEAATLGAAGLWPFGVAAVITVGVSLIPKPKTNAA
jgi:hypothetical protein